MHEMSITRNMVELCVEQAGGRRITSVTLKIGELAGVDPEAIEFCFEACARGTVAAQAVLVMEKIAGRGCCRHCSHEFPLAAYHDPCPACGSFGAGIIAGDELQVRELTVE